MEPSDTPELDPAQAWALLAATPAWLTREYLRGLTRTHTTLATPAMEYLASLGPVELKALRPGTLAASLRFLEVARVVYDLTDPDEAFEAYAYLTERIQLPEAAELIDRVLLEV